MKNCRICRTEKPVSDFYFRKDTNSQRAECKTCTQEGIRYRTFGIGYTDYIEMLTVQRGCCAICNNLLNSSRYTKLSIDHCHVTKKVRGLLCNNCNTAIGLLKDSTERMQSAINYLNKSRVEEIVCSHG